MSSNVPINTKTKPKPKGNTKISQSIPAYFYKNYVPPKTPKINPIQPTNPVPDFQPLPMTSPNTKGIDIKTSGSYSMKRNQHPMSMPIRHGIMGPNTRVPFAHINNEKNPPLKEEKEEPSSSLEKNIRGLKVGSFTCFDVLQSKNPLKPIDDKEITEDDAVSAVSGTASTFDSDKFEQRQTENNDQDIEDEEEDDDALFTLE